MTINEPALTDSTEYDTDCAVVGGGPGGLILAYLLARSGVRVTLLEGHNGFDRDFRGDSLHAYTLELLDQLGLADRLLELPHFKATRFRAHTPTSSLVLTDYATLKSRFNFMTLMPQVRFLDFLAAEAAGFENFTLLTGARVRKLVVEGDRVTGVRWRAAGAEHTLRARVVVAADGRFSKLRALSELPVTDLEASSDLLWFRLPRRPEDPPEADLDLYFGPRNYVALLGGVEDWQLGYTLPKGGYASARAAGVGPIRDFLRRHLPWLGDRVELLTSFDQTTLLSVELKRVTRWHRPGLLLIGDAAHVISPVGGNGILMAIQDAVTTTNHLVPALRRPGPVPDAVLAAIQADREPAIVRVQADQARVEQRLRKAREAGRPLITGPITGPLLKIVTALPGARAASARSNSYGPNPPALDLELLRPPAETRT